MPLTPHDEYYHKMRDKAHDKMARVTGHEADGDDELRCSLAYALKHGTAEEAAEAISARHSPRPPSRPSLASTRRSRFPLSRRTRTPSSRACGGEIEL